MNNKYNQFSKKGYTDTRDQDIKFVKRFSSKMNEEDGLVYMPPKKTYKFYQICSFKNPDTQKYDVRVILFDEYSEITKTGIYMVPAKECNELINKCRSNQYKIYQAYYIESVDLPSMDDLLVMQSPLLSD